MKNVLHVSPTKEQSILKYTNSLEELEVVSKCIRNFTIETPTSMHFFINTTNMDYAKGLEFDIIFLEEEIIFAAGEYNFNLSTGELK